jgi:hypothetical protein
MGGQSPLESEPLELGWFHSSVVEPELSDQPFAIDAPIVYAVMMQTAIAVYVHKNPRETGPHVFAAIEALHAEDTSRLLEHVEALSREIEAGFERENPGISEGRDSQGVAVFRAAALLYVIRGGRVSAPGHAPVALPGAAHMIMDHVRAVIAGLPADEFTTRAIVRGVNRRRMAKGKRPLMRGGVKRDLIKLAKKGEIAETGFNRWTRRGDAT